MSNKISVDRLKEIYLHDPKWIDVRAPVEFAQGHLPGAVNLPILNDAERSLIGTTYKQQGQEVAVALGYKLISGAVKEERVSQWKNFLAKHPQAMLYCFRGGKRSQISQGWLKDIGLDRPLLNGGYKAARQFFIHYVQEVSERQSVLLVSGPTGSGKTQLLQNLSSVRPTLDLEGLASHRGSAFGFTQNEQPSQADFENSMATAMIKFESRLSAKIPLLVEDESRLIGKLGIPEKFFERLRVSPVVWLEEPLEIRVENIFKDYILETPLGLSLKDEQQSESALTLLGRYEKALMSLQRRLGGLRTQEILADFTKARAVYTDTGELDLQRHWIEKLLVYYYDPLYLNSLQRRQVQVVFKGSSHEARAFLSL